MPQKQPRPAGWEPDRAGLGDFCGQRESGLPINENPYQVQAARRLRRQRQVERICALGARAVFELVDELDRHHDLGGALDDRLQKYAQADPELLCAFGADRFVELPTRQIWGRP